MQQPVSHYGDTNWKHPFFFSPRHIAQLQYLAHRYLLTQHHASALTISSVLHRFQLLEEGGLGPYNCTDKGSISVLKYTESVE